MEMIAQRGKGQEVLEWSSVEKTEHAKSEPTGDKGDCYNEYWAYVDSNTYVDNRVHYQYLVVERGLDLPAPKKRNRLNFLGCLSSQVILFLVPTLIFATVVLTLYVVSELVGWVSKLMLLHGGL